VSASEELFSIDLIGYGSVLGPSVPEKNILSLAYKIIVAKVNKFVSSSLLHHWLVL
jgi:hypothetical protein